MIGKFDFKKHTTILILAFIVIYVIGGLINFQLKVSYLIGVIAIIELLVYLSINNFKFNKQDYVPLIINSAIVLVIMILLWKYMPSAFQKAAKNIASMVGL